MKSKFIISILCLVFFSSFTSAVLISDQGTDVKNKTSGSLLSLGNLSISIYDNTTKGSLIYEQNFSDTIVNGSWNLMINPNLEYGRSYWKDYKINGEDLDFDSNERLEFHSSSGKINNVSFINLSLINSCSTGSSIRVIYENGSVECETDDNSGTPNLTNYALKNQSEIFTGNVTTSQSGFFGWLGSLSSRITKLFVQDIDASGNINATGNVTASKFVGDGSLLTNLPTGNEGEPLWSANYTLFNMTWSTDTDTWNTSSQIWTAIDNGTFIKTGAGEPLWSANYTAFNTTWSTDTWNTSAQIWTAIDNGTFLKSYTESDSKAYNGTLAYNSSLSDYYPRANPYGYLNTSSDSFVGNYSTFLTHIDWSKVVNGTVMLASNWNATNTSYYLVTNPFGFYNSTTLPASGEPLWSANLTAHNSSWNSNYNSTYNTWAYNQTIPANSYTDIKLLDYLNLSGTNANQNINISPYNLTSSGSGMFSFLGSFVSRISKLWVIDINASGNIETSQNVSASYVKGDGSQLTNLPAGTELTGVIKIYAGTTAPIGYLIANGSEVSRTTYADLYNIIGTTYGVGDGSTTFNLPNLTGRVVVGKSGDTEFDNLGETGGEKNHTLTINEMPSHAHNVTDPGHIHNINQLRSSTSGSQTTNILLSTDTSSTLGTYNTNSTTTGITIGTNGTGNSFNNLQPYIVINYIIKY